VLENGACEGRESDAVIHGRTEVSAAVWGREGPPSANGSGWLIQLQEARGREVECTGRADEVGFLPQGTRAAYHR